MNEKNFINITLKSIKSGENIEKCLSDFSNIMSNEYFKTANINLAYSYFTLYEMSIEDKGLNPYLDSYVKRFHSIMGSYLDKSFTIDNYDKLVILLDTLRNEVIKNMNVLTYYTDALTVFEYVLNRLEGKFNDAMYDADDEFMTKRIINYVFDTNDNVVVNTKIQEIIGQLPIRMAKSKFYDMVCNGLSIYKGSENSALQDYLYVLSTSGMIYAPDGITELFTDLSQELDEFRNLNFKELSEQEIENYNNKISDMAIYIEEVVNGFMMLQDSINNLYVALLMKPYEYLNDYCVLQHAENLINKVFEEFYKDGKIENVEKHLIALEGELEDNFTTINRLEGALVDVLANHKKILGSLMLDKIYHSLDRASKLLSTSVFVEFNKENIVGVVDENIIKEESEKLISKFDEVFSNQDRVLNRAIMANVINKLPIFFNTADEFTTYVANSLSGCTDAGEKRAAKHLINSLIEDYENFM